MFRFKTEQKILDIAGTKVGGQPGEYPTVLVGSIFYDRHKIVSDPMEGHFDKRLAEVLINRVGELSEKTGNPYFLDVVGNTPQALTEYIDFVSDATDCPFLVDGPSSRVRLPVMKHAIEVGLVERAIYNSIDYHVTDDEVKFLKDLNVQNTVIMAFSTKKPWAEGRIDVLRGYPGQKGLLTVAEEAGIKNTLIDTAVMDVPSIGIAADAVYLVKDELGLPVGCGPANAITMWKRVKKEQEFGPHAYAVCDASASAITLMMGADFVLYGPIEDAEKAFPACAMTDALVAYAAKRFGTTTKTKNHPLYKIF